MRGLLRWRIGVWRNPVLAAYIAGGLAGRFFALQQQHNHSNWIVGPLALAAFVWLEAIYEFGATPMRGSKGDDQ